MEEPSEDRPWLLALMRAMAPPLPAVQRLIAEFGSLEAAFAEARRMPVHPGLEALRHPDWKGVERDLRWIERDGNDFIAWNSPRYPAQLAEIADPPPGLFVRGDARLLPAVQLAIVGSRRPSADGRRIAAAFARDLAAGGVTITSGMALGIDAAAHRGALDAHGTTVAVLGNGLESIYPSSHRALADEIASRGALVSEFPCDCPARPFHFPRRNRIISGLSVGVLVVEAGLRSGSLITARLALEQGREVFAVPGCIRNPMARGCHKLIRDGAKLVETIDDVVEELGPLARYVSGRRSDPGAEVRPAKALDAGSKLLLDNIGYQPVSIDFLIEATTIPPGLTASLLSQLEIAGLVEALPGGNYVRR